MRPEDLREQDGITGLETAIVLIAFVVVADVFVSAVITTGLFNLEQAAESATAGIGEAATTLTPFPTSDAFQPDIFNPGETFEIKANLALTVAAPNGVTAIRTVPLTTPCP